MRQYKKARSEPLGRPKSPPIGYSARGLAPDRPGDAVDSPKRNGSGLGNRRTATAAGGKLHPLVTQPEEKETLDEAPQSDQRPRSLVASDDAGRAGYASPPEPGFPTHPSQPRHSPSATRAGLPVTALRHR